MYEYDEEYYSDSSSNSSLVEIKSPDELAQEFKFFESNNIQELYYIIKNEYNWLLDLMQFNDLLEFITNSLFYKTTNTTKTIKTTKTTIDKNTLIEFKIENIKEINNTFFIVDNFVKEYKYKYKYNTYIYYNNWIDFCYKFTTS